MTHKTNNWIWIGILVFAVAGQWAFHRNDLLEKIFRSGEIHSSGRKIAYWVAPMDPTYVSDKPGKSPMGMDLVPVYEDEPVSQPDSQEGAEGIPGVDFYYTCGMHPNVRETEPGNCPICGMNLVKKTLSRAGNPAQVIIDPVTVQNIGMRSVPVEVRRLSKTIRAVGRVDYDETRIASVTTKMTGWAEKLYIDFTGQKVRKGDPLIEIYSPELVTTQEEYLQALKFHDYFKGEAYSEAVRQSKDLLSSTRKRLELWDITDEQIAELERTKQVKKSMTIHSPISGIVIHKLINEGENIMPNKHLYEIADISKVWVQAEIYEYELPWVKVGQPVTMTLAYYPGKKFSGRISFIYPYLDATTRTIKLRFAFENPDLMLKPEMYANVFIESTPEHAEIIVPLSSVILSGERSIVILDLGEGKFEPREVTTGMESDGYYTILAGLDEGNRVVTSAQFLIDSESRLKEAQMKMFNPDVGLAPSSGVIPQAETTEAAAVHVTLAGEAEMRYTCPMPEDMVFAADAGKCPVCGMNLIEMTEDDHKRLQKFQKNHPVKRVK